MPVHTFTKVERKEIVDGTTGLKKTDLYELDFFRRGFDCREQINKSDDNTLYRVLGIEISLSIARLISEHSVEIQADFDSVSQSAEPWPLRPF